MNLPKRGPARVDTGRVRCVVRWRNVAIGAAMVVFGAPAVAMADVEAGGPIVDRRWDLVAAALFGLAVSIVGLRRWGHQSPPGSMRGAIDRQTAAVDALVESGPVAAVTEGIARRRERRRPTVTPGGSKGSAVLKLDAGQVDALTARYGVEGTGSILTAIEQRAKRHLRGEHDRLVTLGRGEMVIMLEGLSSPLVDAEKIAKRLSVDARRPVDHKGVLLFPTLSIGIAHSKVPGDIERLLAEADRALRETSGEGRIALNDTGAISTS